ncbi:Nuclear pore complex protein NUP1 [Bienertia sinuspersici]
MATERSTGAGGKLRKKAARSIQSTPYDRPASALRPTSRVRENLNHHTNNGWFSKLVDPASRLITAGAQRLFPSVFRKRLLPPPPHSPPDETMEIGDLQPEITTMVAPSGVKEPLCKGNDSRISNNGGVAELEGILKQKTFTRQVLPEIDHLTAVLLSRTADKSVGAQMGSLESKSLDEMTIPSRREVPSNLPALENGAGHVLPEATLTPDVRSKALEDAVASPAELAKAYMGSRPTKASPSMVGVQNEMSREDLSALYNPFMKQKTPDMSLIQKPVNDVGTSANGFMTPRFRGRSAIYSMARTPYSKPQSTKEFKAAETASDVHGVPSLPHNAAEIQQLSGSSRQALKRRSSIVESDIGFVGPIRRIRQKPNLLNHKTSSLPASGGFNGKFGCGAHTDVTGVPSIDWSSKHHSSWKAHADNGMPSTSNGYVPSQSIEMAQKIFQQLDKFTSKGKSPEKSADIAEGSSTRKVASNIRDGLAHKSMSTAGSLKVLESVQESRKENCLLDSINASDNTRKISPKVDEGGEKKFVMTSASDGGSPNKLLDHVNSQPSFDHQQKKRSFQMSAHEDYLELDDDVLTNGVASTPVIKGLESREFAKNSDALSANPQSASISAGKYLALEPKPSTCSVGTDNEDSLPEGSADQKISGFAFSAVPSASAVTCTSTQAAVSSPQPTADVKKVAEQSDKSNMIPAFGSNSAVMTTLPFSPSSSMVEPAAANDINTEFPSSVMDAAAKADEPDKFDKMSTTLFGDISKNVGDATNEASSVKGFFAFGLPSNSAAVSNGLPNTVSATFGVSSPVQTSSSTNYLNPVPVSVSSPSLFSFSNGSTVSTSASSLAAPAGTVVTSATTGILATFGGSSSQLSTSMTAPSVSFGSTFQFGSSAVPSTSSIAETSASESAAISGVKSNQFAFGNATSSMFSAKSSVTASVGNDISGFNPTFKTTSSETQTTASAVTNGSIFGLQALSSSAFPVSTAIPSFSSQSASSTSSHAFGSNTPSSNASASIFGSSSTVANPFTSGSTSSVTEPVSSSSNTASSIFGWQSSKPAVPGCMFGTSFQSAGFSVGSTASVTSAGNSTPIVFGATSSTSAASNNTPFVFGSGTLASSVFPVSSAPSSTPFPSQQAFGSSTPQAFPFNSTPSAGNNDRMSMEDSMAEDSVQVSTPAVPVFGVPNSAPSGGFAFGAAAPSTGSPFQFGGQQNQNALQNTSFQPSGSLEFNAGGGGGAGSFSLGSGGGDKANRRFVKVKKGVRRK